MTHDRFLHGKGTLSCVFYHTYDQGLLSCVKDGTRQRNTETRKTKFLYLPCVFYNGRQTFLEKVKKHKLPAATTARHQHATAAATAGSRRRRGVAVTAAAAATWRPK
jgi:hypothetical protein